MNELIQKINNKIAVKGNKKTVENLIVFIIILIITVVFINYIWKDDKKSDNKSGLENLAINNNTYKVETVGVSNNSLEFELEGIIKQLDGVSNAKVLITYEESNRIVPIYNEDIQESVTQEEDNQGGVRTINETSSKKEVVYEEENGLKRIVTSNVINPKIKGAVIVAKGANNPNVKNNIIQVVQAATGLATHKIQVFEMK